MNYPTNRATLSGVMADSELSAIDGTLISHNVWIAGHRTSVRLEPVMWQALQDIGSRENLTIHELATIVSERKHGDASLTASLRAFIVAYLRQASTGRDKSPRRARRGLQSGEGEINASFRA
jgi:predicted DNA-binding ribbon-helix-helix protein